MLVFDRQYIGEKLRVFRKKAGLTQVQLAERAGLSERTYADIERGVSNMRVETLLSICSVLKITPDQILTREADNSDLDMDDIWSTFNSLSSKEKDTVAQLVAVYLRSVE